MSNNPDEKKEEIVLTASSIFNVPIMLIVTTILLFKAYNGIDRRDIDYGFALFYASLFLNIGLSFAIKNQTFIKFFSGINFLVYALFLVLAASEYSSNDRSFFIVSGISIIILHGLYYMGRSRKSPNQQVD